MKTTLEKAALELLGLPAASRALLAEKLLASLEDEPACPDVDKAWKREALRRYNAFKAGKIAGRPHAEVMRDAYRAIKSRPK
jgi:putative addiction module component (TIGR02574 family)